MVASFLRAGKGANGLICWVLALYVSGMGQSGAEEGHPQTFYAQSNAPSFFEEDLLPQELPPADVPAVPSETSPAMPPSAPRELQTHPPAVAPPPSVYIPLSPHDVVALRFVEEGKGLLEQGQFDQARERFEEAVAVAPLQPYSYYFLGRVTFAQGDHKQALAFLRKAELLFGANDQAWRGETSCLKGAIYEELGDNQQARVAYQQCLEFVPQNLRALSALARLPAEEPPLYDEYAPPAPPLYPRD